MSTPSSDSGAEHKAMRVRLKSDLSEALKQRAEIQALVDAGDRVAIAVLPAFQKTVDRLSEQLHALSPGGPELLGPTEGNAFMLNASILSSKE